jgi:hypothetical protein
MADWIKTLFHQTKPVIAMAHVPALPGTPRYDMAGGVEALIKAVRPDVERLVAGGVDAIMFCNEDDRPYVFKAGIEQIAAMTRVVTECAPKGIPYGVDFLWDPYAAIAMAYATGASFIREVFTGVYESDMGLWAPSAGDIMRYRQSIGAAGVRLFYNVVPECAPVRNTAGRVGSPSSPVRSGWSSGQGPSAATASRYNGQGMSELRASDQPAKLLRRESHLTAEP